MIQSRNHSNSPLSQSSHTRTTQTLHPPEIAQIPTKPRSRRLNPNPHTQAKILDSTKILHTPINSTNSKQKTPPCVNPISPQVRACILTQTHTSKPNSPPIQPRILSQSRQQSSPHSSQKAAKM
ncbi:hypothetical protein M758_UG240600 [Ceratodon purpureus]|nr:hypothetical protein M758_UG240600 [Ceratodon purpureus]